ncbi:MAG: hypothetical protein QW101_06375 [Ignisphaera sp.]|uniref:Uncharacterized protein n=1 Tax=Ignisphaera aggregans TaxID=334771 RepID=A0A7J3MYB9_9CREN
MLFVLNSLLIELSDTNLAILSQHVRAKAYDKVGETISKLFTVSVGTASTLFIIYETTKSHILLTR